MTVSVFADCDTVNSILLSTEIVGVKRTFGSSAHSIHIHMCEKQPSAKNARGERLREGGNGNGEWKCMQEKYKTCEKKKIV